MPQRLSLCKCLHAVCTSRYQLPSSLKTRGRVVQQVPADELPVLERRRALRSAGRNSGSTWPCNGCTARRPAAVRCASTWSWARTELHAGLPLWGVSCRDSWRFGGNCRQTNKRARKTPGDVSRWLARLTTPARRATDQRVAPANCLRPSTDSARLGSIDTPSSTLANRVPPKRRSNSRRRPSVRATNDAACVVGDFHRHIWHDSDCPTGRRLAANATRHVETQQVERRIELDAQRPMAA